MSNYACCLQRACNDTPSSCLPWRKAKILLFTLNQKIKLFWWLSAHAHILLIAHEVISINNSSCLLRRPHLSHRSNQMSTVTLSNGTYRLILETPPQNKWSAFLQLITSRSFQQVKYSPQLRLISNIKVENKIFSHVISASGMAVSVCCYPVNIFSYLMKYLNICWMDWNTVLYRHSWSPQDEL